MSTGQKMQDGVNTRSLDLRADARGWLLKILMREHLGASREFGEIYVTAAHPGQVRGNHYHLHTTEWFCVVQGLGRLVTRDMETGEAREVLMSESDPVTVEVLPGVAHSVQNIGSGMMLLLAYADKPYDPDDPDEKRLVLIDPHAGFDGVSAGGARSAPGEATVRDGAGWRGGRIQ
jgi:UDP-2-acetamido-2,6-beta-L-arabino-hexul-4-ose reductase